MGRYVNSAVTAVTLFALVFVAVVWRSDWPEVYGFAAPAQSNAALSWMETPVHLADDVMITLRSGYMLEVLGKPAYNRTDSAQASTSYLAPYAFSALKRLIPGYGAVYVYSALGAAVVALTLVLLCMGLGRPWIALGAVLALSATTTLAEFSLSGWDHVFQGALLVAATVVATRSSASHGTLFTVAVLCALGTLYRPDGVLIALALLWVACRKSRSLRANMLAVAVFVAIVGAALWVNLIQFGHLTPTTARLKVGASPSLEYSLKYVVENGFQSFSALTLFVVFGVFCLLRWRRLEASERWLVGATVITSVAAIINSDAFAHGRMFWTPACVLAVLVVNQISGHELSYSSTLFHEKADGRWPAWAVGACAAATGVYLAAADRPRTHYIDRQEVPLSFTAPQFLLTEWIDRHLTPGDGPIGLYWLGMAYYLPKFDVADFLGKADEMVANSPVKWGPPGHNKWSTAETVRKWNPQVIIPTLPPPRDRDFSKYLAGVRDRLAKKDGWGFVYDLVLDPSVAKAYKYCYVNELRGGEDVWGFYVRNDLATRHAAQLTCYEPLSIERSGARD